MRIAVCDDEAMCCQQAVNVIEATAKSLDIIIDSFKSGRELLKKFSSISYDLVILDIEMPEIDGISLAKRLRELSEDVYIVFLTSHIEFALEGYEVNALRYLTKPVNSLKLKEVLDYIVQKQSKQESLWLKTEEGEEKVSLDEILFLESQNQNVIVHTENKLYTVRYNISDFEKELECKGFIRVHRSFVVSLRKISKLGRNEVFLGDSCSVPVSRGKEKKLSEALFSFVSKEAL